MALYLRPTELDEALAALKAGPLDVLAGGTDYYPARVGQALDGDVLDITRVEGLRGIEDRDDHWLIGAATTWSDIVGADLPPVFDGLKLAAREVGGVQIQNAGTIAGNICNASPAADGVPCLLTLDANVELASAEGARAIRLGDFITGNRETAKRPEELVTGIAIPKTAKGARGGFVKLGARKYLVISIAMAAAVIEPDDRRRVAGARVAVGACSAVAQRLPDLEAALIGRPCDSMLAETAHAEHLSPLTPIDDIRGRGVYRKEAALVLVRRALEHVGTALEANE